MFEKEAEEYVRNNWDKNVTELKNDRTYQYVKGSPHFYDSAIRQAYQKGANVGYNKANEWHYVKDGGLPRQDGHTCFSIEVLANNKKWVYYQFDSGKWYCGNKEVKVIAWKEIVLPELKESE